MADTKRGTKPDPAPRPAAKPARKSKRTCVLCGGPVKRGEEISTYRVEGDIKGFSVALDIEKVFHNACLTKSEGVNEIARAQVLDYLEAVEFNRSVIDDLRNQNLQRAQSILKEIRWKQKYRKPE